MNQKQKNLFNQLRYWLGYSLFGILIIYTLYNAPKELWHLQPVWLLATVFFISLMLVFELAQFFVFLHHHQRSIIDILVPLRIITRKSILNATLPAKTGTLLLLKMVTDSYQLEWHNYLRFVIVATIVMLFISLLAASSLILPLIGFIALIISISGIALLCKHFIHTSYYRNTFALLWIGIGVYLCRVMIFWTILQATNSAVGFKDASYFAIVTNTLAQFPITPGNIGIREALFGLLSPYLALPMSIGVLVGAIFQGLRIVVYAIIMVGTDFIYSRKHEYNYR
ncbi:MAG: hypothetical protein ACE5E7_18865 [Anaerolineae bacterium]